MEVWVEPEVQFVKQLFVLAVLVTCLSAIPNSYRLAW